MVSVFIPTLDVFWKNKQTHFTSVCPKNSVPIAREDKWCGLNSILPHHTSPSTVHVGTLYSSHSTGILQAQVGETQSSTGRVEDDWLNPADAFRYENGSVHVCDGGDLQAGLFDTAPVDIESYPVQGHGSDCVTQEFQKLALRGQVRILQLEGAERSRAVVHHEQGVVTEAVVHDGCLVDARYLQG